MYRLAPLRRLICLDDCQLNYSGHNCAIRDGRMEELQLSTTHTVSCHYVIFTDGAWAVT